MKTKIFLLAVVAYVIFNFFVTQQAGKKALYDFDEGRYAEIAKQYIKTGDWLVPRAGYPDNVIKAGHPQPDFWKPPLQTWFIAASYKLFGINEFTVRFPSLLFSIGAVITAFLLLKLVGVQEKISMFSVGLVVLSSDFSFLSTQGLAEMQLLFFCLLTIYLVERGARDRQKWMFALAGAVLGLGIMTKFVAVFWVILLLFYYLCTRKISWKEVVMILLIAAAVALPWHLYMLARFREVFITRYFLMNTVGRSVGETANRAPLYWYGIYMIDSWRPLVFLLPFLVTLSFKDRTNRFLLLWALAILIPFSVMQSKVWWYIFPAMLPLTVLAVKAFTNRPTLAALAITVGSVPVWQLQYSSIKRQVMSFGLVFLGFMFMAFRKQRRLGHIHIPVSAVVILLALCVFGVQERQAMKYTDQSKDVKIVMARHKGALPRLAVYKMPYEAALFYSDMGTISNTVDKAEYVLTDRNTMQELSGFKRIDQSGYTILLRRSGL